MSGILRWDEREALSHIAAGHTEPEAAEAMGFSTRTLRRRLTSACKVLGARNLVHAVAIAVSLGLIEVDGVPAPASRYRYGDRDRAAVEAHTRETRMQRIKRHPLADQALRSRILAAVQAGTSVAAAARAESLTAATVWGYTRYDPDFRAALDEATRRHRTCSPVSRGRADGYRQGCRCPECRAAHTQETRRYRDKR